MLMFNVKILNKMYKMPSKEALGLIRIAGERVPFGIYAVAKGDYIELTNIRPDSITKLKEEIRNLKREGFKVYYHKGE